jgi:hypothetical protein
MQIILFIDNVPGDDQTSLYFAGFLNTWIDRFCNSVFKFMFLYIRETFSLLGGGLTILSMCMCAKGIAYLCMCSDIILKFSVDVVFINFRFPILSG